MIGDHVGAAPKFKPGDVVSSIFDEIDVFDSLNEYDDPIGFIDMDYRMMVIAIVPVKFEASMDMIHRCLLLGDDNRLFWCEQHWLELTTC